MGDIVSIGSALTAARESLVNGLIADGDRRADDGMIFCGKCGMPKTQWIDSPRGGRFLFPTNCRCMQQEVDAIRKTDAIRENQREAMEREERRVNAFQTRSLMRCTFATDDRKHASISDRLKKYCAAADRMLAKGYGIALTGDTGSGKTFLAAAVANELISRGYTVWMATLREIFDRMGGEFDQDRREECTRKILRTGFLIIDDFGVERGGDFTEERVYSIINARYNTRKPMIITTNLSKADLTSPAAGKSRVYSRICEMCPAVFAVTGDRRAGLMVDRLNDMKEILEG